MKLKRQPLLQLLQLAAALTLVSGADVSSENFSCDGLAAGFYADVASGCQLYHMCDGAGRQFTHACPNQTLFQQRTMVCDHWYMVKCNSLDLEQSAKVLKNENTQGREFQEQQKSQKQHRHSQRVLEPFPYIQRNRTHRRNTTESRKREEFHIGVNLRKEDSINSEPLNKQHLVSPHLQTSIINGESTSSLKTTPERQTKQMVNSDFSVDQITTPFITSPRPSIFSINSEAQFLTSTPSYKIEKFHVDSRDTLLNVETFQQTRNNYRTSHNINVEDEAIKKNTHDDIRGYVNNKGVEDVAIRYNHNPYIQSYIKTISNSNDNSQTYLSSAPTIHSEDERETFENKLEIILPDPRKMFYIPDSDYNQSDISVNERSSVLVIDLPNYYRSPSTRTMKFHKSDGGNQGTNPKCPRCHPSFLLPGQCQPCVLIR